MRTVFVTGGSRGIGEAIARAFAGGGYAVAVGARTQDRLEAVAARLNGLGVPAVAVSCDVTAADSVRHAVDHVVRTLGPIDVLVNNAGFVASAPFREVDERLWSDTIAVNLTGTYTCTAAALPGMLSRGWGRIINVASTAGRKGYAYTTAYCAAKHGVVGLTRALALEVATRGVTVNALCPGWVDTEMTRDSVDRIVVRTGRTPDAARAALEAMSPQRRLMTPDEVAGAALFLASDVARGINGQAIVLDGGEVVA
jgi:3-hydroxybutyrate dehydrogenase